MFRCDSAVRGDSQRRQRHDHDRVHCWLRGLFARSLRDDLYRRAERSVQLRRVRNGVSHTCGRHVDVRAGNVRLRLRPRQPSLRRRVCRQRIARIVRNTLYAVQRSDKRNRDVRRDQLRRCVQPGVPRVRRQLPGAQFRVGVRCRLHGVSDADERDRDV